MTTQNDGGPAFPVNVSCYDGDRSRLYGMSLRDWLASNATDGDVEEFRWFDNGKTRYQRTRECARYAFADAMLMARRARGLDK